MGYTARQVESSIFIGRDDVEHLEELLEEQHGWEFFGNERGDITEINFIADKPMEKDIEVLKSIARYAKEDSFVELVGEDGFRWRWTIKGGEVWEMRPDIKWKTFCGPL